MNKIILNLAMSLDGYIADEDGGYDWIVGDGDTALNTSLKWNFDQFLDSVDIVVMGYHCYEQKMHEQFKNKQVIVATSKILEDEANIHFSNDIVNTVNQLKQQGNVYLFGGGILVDAFLKEAIIEEFIVGIIPVLLGKGKKLFVDHYPMEQLQLKQYYVEDGIVIMHYIKK